MVKKTSKQNDQGEEDVLDLRAQNNFNQNTEQGKDQIDVNNKEQISRDELSIKNTVNIFTQSSIDSSKWLNYGKIILYILLFLLPVFFLPVTIFPVDINKQFIALLLALSSFVFYLVDILVNKRIRYRSNWITISVLLVIISVTLSYFFSQSKNISFYGNLYLPDSLISFITYGLIFFLSSILFKKEDFHKIGGIFLASLGVTSIIGLLQLLGFFIFPFDFTRQTAFNTVGTYFNYGIFLSFSLLLIIIASAEFRLSFRNKVILGALGLLILGQLIVLNYQFLWLEIAAVILLIAAYKFTQTSIADDTDNKKYRPNGMGIPLLALIIASLFFLISPSLPRMVNVPIELMPSLTSTLKISKEGLTGKNIIFGSGPSTFSQKFAAHRPIEINQTNFWAIKFYQGFSFISTFLTTAGVLGVLSFFLLFFTVLLTAYKNFKNGKAITVIIGILFLLIQLFLNNAFFVQLAYIFLGLGIISAFTESCDLEFTFSRAGKPKLFIAFILVFFLIIGSLSLLYSNVRKYIAAIYYGKVAVSGNLETSLKYLDKAAAIDTDTDQYLRDLSQFILLDASNQYSKVQPTSELSTKANKIISDEIALAVQIAQRATFVNPFEPLNWSNLANIYEKIIFMVDGADIFAEKNYKEAINRDPNNPGLYVSLANVMISSADRKNTLIGLNSGSKENDDKKTKAEIDKQLNDAEEILEKAIELKNDYAPARFQIAMILVRQGKAGDAINKLEETKKYAPYDSQLYFQLGLLYYSDKQLNKAKVELERAVSLNENYSDARYILGLVYDKNGFKSKAIEQFKKILALNSENENVKKILKNLEEGKDALEGLRPTASVPVNDSSSEENVAKDNLNISE